MGEAADVFRAVYAAYLANDWATLVELYAPDAELNLPGRPPIVGRDAIIEQWKRTRTAFPDDGGSYQVLIEQGDIAAGEKLYSGTHSGPLQMSGRTIPPTGKRFSIADSDFMIVKNGKCVAHRVYFDLLALTVQLGLMPPPQVDRGGR
jgi:predicted ester cyclase